MTNKYCVDINVSTEIGEGFKLNHAYGIVINQRTPIGKNVYIGHNVTIGANGVDRFPKIGDGVTISTGSLVIGDVTIGNNTMIGAGSLVIKDVPANAVIVGTPAKLLKYLEP